MNFPRTRLVLDTALADGAFPAAVVEVGQTAGPMWSYACGRLTFSADAPAATPVTIFDLASLTKVMATASLMMRAIERGLLTLDTRLGERLTGWNTGSRADVRLRQLLDHSAGLLAHDRFWEVAEGRRQFEQVLLSQPLERPPGVAAVYSDPGFMLLGFVLEDAAGGLPSQFTAFAQDASLGEVRYGIDPSWMPRVAPTEIDPWRGRLLVGEVHDGNAAALGGAAGHAGLFGTAAAVGAFARLVLRTFREATSLGTPELMKTFATPTGVPESSRALAWDTMRLTSSCGTRLSPSAIGHTGFTGTSLWIDRERDLYVVLLSNRVHPSRNNDRFVAVRPRVHDAVVADLEGS